ASPKTGHRRACAALSASRRTAAASATPNPPGGDTFSRGASPYMNASDAARHSRYRLTGRAHHRSGAHLAGAKKKGPLARAFLLVLLMDQRFFLVVRFFLAVAFLRAGAFFFLAAVFFFLAVAFFFLAGAFFFF